MAISLISYGAQRCLILPLETEETSRKATSKRPDIIRQRLVGLLMDSINYVLFNPPPPKRTLDPRRCDAGSAGAEY
jgi:hypothetical protein